VSSELTSVKMLNAMQTRHRIRVNSETNTLTALRKWCIWSHRKTVRWRHSCNVIIIIRSYEEGNILKYLSTCLSSLTVLKTACFPVLCVQPCLGDINVLKCSELCTSCCEAVNCCILENSVWSNITYTFVKIICK